MQIESLLAWPVQWPCSFQCRWKVRKYRGAQTNIVLISHIQMVIFLSTNLSRRPFEENVLASDTVKIWQGGLAPRPPPPWPPWFHRPWLQLSFRFTRGLIVAIGPIFIVIVSTWHCSSGKGLLFPHPIIKFLICWKKKKWSLGKAGCFWGKKFWPKF